MSAELAITPGQLYRLVATLYFYSNFEEQQVRHRLVAGTPLLYVGVDMLDQSTTKPYWFKLWFITNTADRVYTYMFGIPNPVAVLSNGMLTFEPIETP